MLNRFFNAILRLFSGRSAGPRVEFDRPAGWSEEIVQGGTLFMAPDEEAGWQANIFVETRFDHESRSLPQALDEVAGNLARTKENFQELNRESGMLRSGLKYSRLTYNNTCGGVLLTDWEVMIALDEDERPKRCMLFVLASSASALWHEYAPTFDSFLQSIRKA